MLEIVWDLAPGADLAFCTGFPGTTGMVNAITGPCSCRVSCTGAVIAIFWERSLPPKMNPARRRKPVLVSPPCARTVFA